MTNTATVLTQPTGASYAYTNRILYMSGVTNGTHELHRCLIVSNKATRSDSDIVYEHGDGAYVASGTVVFDACTIATNHGEGVRGAAGTTTIRNSIL